MLFRVLISARCRGVLVTSREVHRSDVSVTVYGFLQRRYGRRRQRRENGRRIRGGHTCTMSRNRRDNMKRMLLAIFVSCAALAAVGTGTSVSAAGNSDAAHACQQGGYTNYVGIE